METWRIFAYVTIGCWSVFMLVWAAMARGAKRSVREEKRSERRAYSLPTAFGMILIAISTPQVWGGENLLTTLVLPLGLAFAAAGAAAAMAGLALAIWARVTLGRDWSVNVTLKEGHELVTGGPYALIRHPIYTAVILLVIGLFLLFETLGGVLGVGLVVLGCWIKLRQEEVLMIGQFPESYPAYMARTKRLIPFVV
ncbi:MAG: isoprenylcysteine carboxylmethyltransferase family protein [Candidatus Andeanibacterium colombiense]|uniref:Isoprenylcysteine carboxylmethyltransferase family protein n=1 Tax=Candidatus Andeanibacterium colombiense TaxID=3121345 RepID=A0AAJ6BLX9_9SPHN|nr:MAG: isoprenylcysteine carboxylmethyltransferase family protein [Sphingomonadaceae bacterium]